MAAYAALVSLLHIIDEIEHHPRPPISLDKKQVESLTKNVTFLREFLEAYPHIGSSSNEEGEGLESRIVDAAHAAEDVIESHIVDRILGESTEKIISIEFHQKLQKVMENMDLIKKEVMVIEEKMGVQHQPPASPPPHDTIITSSSNTTMVGFDDVLLEIMDKLVGGERNRQITPIVGMGGIGKTTLARNIYAKPLIKEHFHICAWVTISQEYNTRVILTDVLRQSNQDRRVSSDLSEKTLGEDLHKYLSARKYLIIMDDMWSIDVWDKIKFYFPDCINGSRIVVTTRLSNLASQLTSSYNLNIDLLDKDKSWDLFTKIVFPTGKVYPARLERIGKRIVGNCRGLPLSIVAIGGFLAKSEKTREFWEHIQENLNSIVNLDNDEHCFKILKMSYDQLPVYLRPCFLYMGVFGSGTSVRVSNLVKLWACEGFVRAIKGKSFEGAARECFEELVDRNLIMVDELGSVGNIKYCKMHDLLRDMCIKQAQKERFYNVHTPPRGITNRHVIRESALTADGLHALHSMRLARSLIFNFRGALPSYKFRLLRILNACDGNLFNASKYFFDNVLELVNSRYLAVRAHWSSDFTSSFQLLWNLHTLIVVGPFFQTFTAPGEIWDMPQLRHVDVAGFLYLPEPSRSSGVVLENLQTLKTILDFQCGEEVVRKAPNVRKLGIYYGNNVARGVPAADYSISNLHCLHKLESLRCESFPRGIPHEYLQKLRLPLSLKKLSLGGNCNDVHWEDMLGMIGSLPLLEKLQLIDGSFKTRHLETVEGLFRALKFLKISRCPDLEWWTAESSHFPRLEQLHLAFLDQLREIPPEIGDIPTLQLIQLRACSDSALISAKRILVEQEELHGDQLALQLQLRFR